MDKIEIKDILTKYPIVLCQEHFDKLEQDLKSLMDNWISVDEPPKHDKDVIVWYSEHNKDIALYNKEKDEWLNTRSQKVKPKLWMEFPQPPKDK